MHIIASIVISALMVLGSLAYQNEKAPALGASQSISSLTAKTTLQGDDLLAIVDNSGTPTTKKITAGNATSSMKAYNDLTYSPIFSTSAGLASLLSDETGSSGGFVRATGASIGTPTITSPTFDVAGTDATGDIYYNGGSGLLTRLPIGANQKYLMASTTGLAEWSNDYILTNPQTSSSTFTATTSFSGSSLTNNALIINGLAYQFPSTLNASSSMLTTDASGRLIWETRAGTTTSGTIADNTNTACTTGGGTNTDVNVTHGLGATPNSITISANILADGASGDGDTGGMVTWDSNGNIRNGFVMRRDGGVTTPIAKVDGFQAAGSGNPSETVTLSVPTATSTGFTFRINCVYVTSDVTSTVTNIKWTATR